MSDALRAAREWVAGDPDPATAAELQHLIDAGDMGALALAMGNPLTFGTAGIRGVVGPGSGRINRATIIKTTRGLADHLSAQGRGSLPVVLGFDARPSSRPLAEATAGVLVAAGIAVHFFPEVTPTPLVAYAAKTMGAGAAVVITASHNPPADNGYKVYGANAAQIIPPEDRQIADEIAGTGSANTIPMVADAFSLDHPLISHVDPSLFDRYLDEVDSARPSAQTSEVCFVYTPMHGVGGRFLAQMFDRAGHTGLIPVPEQFEPDGRFPTVTFPNPEEEGALDLALAMATRLQADAILANDPDADRLATAVAEDGAWRLLTGNELGALLGDFVLRNWAHDETPIVANSIVSSPILAYLAREYGARHEQTLTGFKWIVNAALALEDQGAGRFAFGFEEALGYTIGKTVLDKDGLSAALVFADLVVDEARQGGSVLTRLREIWSRVGLWVSTQHSIVVPGPGGSTAITAAVAKLGGRPPDEVGNTEVTAVTDYRIGAEERPIWLGAQDLIELTLGEEGRVLVRPSGTEPKLKIYVDLTSPSFTDSAASHRELTLRADAIAGAMGEWLGL